MIAARVVERDVTNTQSFVGTVAPVKRALVGSAVAGRVIEVPIEEGDRVKAGQPLAQLLTETISLEIAQAEGELALRQAELEELENGSRPEEIAQAEAVMHAARSRRDFLKSRLNRLEAAARLRGAITEDEVHEARANAEEAEQTFLQTEAAHKLAVEGPRAERIAQARAQVKMQQAVVDRLMDQRKKYTVRTKFDGYVVLKETEEGDWLNQGDPVAEVLAIDEVDVVAEVGEASLAHIAPGQTTPVTFPALPSPDYTGKVQAIIPLGDIRTRTFSVKVRLKNQFQNQVPLLKPGMYARVRLRASGESPGLMVPKDALRLGGPKPVIFLVPGDTKPGATAKARMVPVELGMAEAGLIQVIGQVGKDELVLVEGQARLAPGAEVLVRSVQDVSLYTTGR